MKTLLTLQIKLKTYSVPNPNPMIPAPRKVPNIRSSLNPLIETPEEKDCLFIILWKIQTQNKVEIGYVSAIANHSL